MRNLTNSKTHSLLLTITLLMATLTVASAYIVAPASAQAADWPMFHHDSALTGVATGTSPSKVYVKWMYKTGSMVISSPAVVDGKVYIGSQDKYLYCLDGAAGTLVWKYATGGIVDSSPAVADGKVYFGSGDNYVYCLTTAGSLVWRYKTGGIVWCSPNVVNGKVYIGSGDYYVYCLYAANGTLVWKYPTGGKIFRECPAVVNGRVYIGSLDHKVYCLSATTTNPAGQLLWNRTTGDGFAYSSCTVVDGRVFVGNNEMAYPPPTPYNFYCFNATTGVTLWRFKMPEIGWLSNPVQTTAAVYGGKVWIGMYASVECLDAATGKGVPGYAAPNTGFTIRSSPAYWGGKIYIGTCDRMFYIFDAATGARLYSYQSTSGWESSPAIADGKIYIGSTNGYVYCFVEHVGTVSTTLSCSAFPASIPLGVGTEVSGNIFPGVLLAAVTVTYTKPDGTTMSRNVAAMQDGRYANYITPDLPGIWSVKASWEGITGFSGATSPTANFTVTGTLPPVATTIDSWVDPTSLPLGDTTYIRGAIKWPAVSGATVTLTYTAPNATTITRTVTSGTDGTYEDPFTPDMEGDWSVKASWAGDAAHTGSTSTAATFTVTAAVAPPPAAIPVEYIYGIAAVIVIAIIAIVAYMYMRRKK